MQILPKRQYLYFEYNDSLEFWNIYSQNKDDNIHK